MISRKLSELRNFCVDYSGCFQVKMVNDNRLERYEVFRLPADCMWRLGLRFFVALPERLTSGHA